MTEEEAKAWVEDRFGPAATARVDDFLAAVRAENAEQNLVSAATLDSMWSRHAADSAQLLTLAPADWSVWLDIGTGGGFPGMIVALLAFERHVVMVEPRRRRAAFLQSSVESLGLPKAAVLATKVENVDVSADVISARAVARPSVLYAAASRCAHARTTWLLPRGRSAIEALSERSAMFHVEHSITDAESLVQIVRGKPR